MACNQDVWRRRSQTDAVDRIPHARQVPRARVGAGQQRLEHRALPLAEVAAPGIQILQRAGDQVRRITAHAEAGQVHHAAALRFDIDGGKVAHHHVLREAAAEAIGPDAAQHVVAARACQQNVVAAKRDIDGFDQAPAVVDEHHAAAVAKHHVVARAAFQLVGAHAADHHAFAVVVETVRAAHRRVGGFEQSDPAGGGEHRPRAVARDQVETARAHRADDVVAHAAKQRIAARAHRDGVHAARWQVDVLQQLQANARQIARVRTRRGGVNEVAAIAQVVDRLHVHDAAEVGEHDVVAIARRDRVGARRQAIRRRPYRQPCRLLRRQHQRQRGQRLLVGHRRHAHVHRRIQVDVHAGVAEYDVVALACMDDVVAAAARDQVIAQPAIDHVVARAAVQDDALRGGACVQHVVAAVAKVQRLACYALAGQGGVVGVVLAGRAKQQHRPVRAAHRIAFGHQQVVAAAALHQRDRADRGVAHRVGVVALAQHRVHRLHAVKDDAAVEHMRARLARLQHRAAGAAQARRHAQPGDAAEVASLRVAIHAVQATHVVDLILHAGLAGRGAVIENADAVIDGRGRRHAVIARTQHAIGLAWQAHARMQRAVVIRAVQRVAFDQQRALDARHIMRLVGVIGVADARYRVHRDDGLVACARVAHLARFVGGAGVRRVRHAHQNRRQGDVLQAGQRRKERRRQVQVKASQAQRRQACARAVFHLDQHLLHGAPRLRADTVGVKRQHYALVPGQPAVGGQQQPAPLQALQGSRHRIRRVQAHALRQRAIQGGRHHRTAQRHIRLARSRTRQHAGIQIDRQRQRIAAVGVQLARLRRDADRLRAIEHVARTAAAGHDGVARHVTRQIEGIAIASADQGRDDIAARGQHIDVVVAFARIQIDALDVLVAGVQPRAADAFLRQHKGVGVFRAQHGVGIDPVAAIHRHRAVDDVVALAVGLLLRFLERVDHELVIALSAKERQRRGVAVDAEDVGAVFRAVQGQAEAVAA